MRLRHTYDHFHFTPEHDDHYSGTRRLLSIRCLQYSILYRLHQRWRRMAGCGGVVCRRHLHDYHDDYRRSRCVLCGRPTDRPRHQLHLSVPVVLSTSLRQFYTGRKLHWGQSVHADYNSISHARTMLLGFGL